MSVKLVSTILQNKRVGDGRLLLVVLADHCFGDSLTCYPSVSRLAELCECSDRAVYRGLEKLRHLGYITLKRRQNQPSVFTLHPDKMPDLRTDAGVSSEPLSTDASVTSELTLVTPRPDASVSCNKEEQVFNRLKATGKQKHVHARAFVPPTLEQVTTYCQHRQNSVDPQAFLDHYNSNGWRVGRNPMKDWQAAVRTWEHNGFGNLGSRPTLSERNHQARLEYERTHPESA